MLKKKTTFIVAAGSGGHIIPAQAYAQRYLNNEITIFLTSNRPLEKQLLPDDPTTIRFPILRFPGKKLWRLPKFLYTFCTIFCKSLFLFLQTSGNKTLFSTGEILTIPIALAAWILRIPITILELNAIEGKTTRFLKPFATTILNVFQNNHLSKTIPYPLRFYSKKETIQKNSSKTIIALFGGSQGSTELNTFFLNWLETIPLPYEKMQIYHFYGNDSRYNFQTWYQERGIEAITSPWCQHPETIYPIANLLFSRGGSGTLHELAHFQTKTIILPLRTVANDHQYANAKTMENTYPNLFLCLDAPLLTPTIINKINHHLQLNAAQHKSH